MYEERMHIRLKGRYLLALMLVFLGVGTRTSGLAQPTARLPHTNLLVYHNAKGAIAEAKSLADWQKRRAEILKGCQAVMGPYPGKEKRCRLDVITEAERDRGNYVERLITYSSEPHSRVPAYLLIPKEVLHRTQKCPAVLALHPTDMQDGHKVVIEELRESYRAYGKDLVERGYVVLAPAYPLMANYQPDLKALGYQSGTMKAIWDNARGVDLLEALPFVKKGKVGAIGHSLGAHNAIYTAVFDTRIKVVVSSCGFDSFVDYKDGDIRGWTSERYMPALQNYRARLQDAPFDFHELIAALAPRPVFINAPLGDSNFKWRSVDEIVQTAQQVYRLYGLPDALKLEHPDCGHDFPPQIREEAYQFLDTCLRK